ncbi:GlxA family transcriptional regulator [Mumia sp. Pv 4-285]|uniref:GlxA family transcriptional regulator n=1 Tax=Mumia qirimensis TaxID=3234852 RepID=UPI00351CF669
MLTKVALLTVPGVTPFEFGVVCEVFGIDRSDTGGPRFELALATAEPGPVPTSQGVLVTIENDLSVADDADLIAVPAFDLAPVDERYLRVIRDAEARGAWVLSICTGAFALAESGVLDGRRATTHWMFTAKLAAQYPRTRVDADVLYVQDGKVVTSAGTAAGIDAALHIVRQELGAGHANVIARRMVVPPQRDGGQAQFIQTPVGGEKADSFAVVAQWMLQNLSEDLSVEQLARKALMSPRTFARRFRADMGTTPTAWLNRQRIIHAQQLLEQSSRSLEAIAAETGFGNAAVMRHHFVKVLRTSPMAYRRTFGERLVE